MQRNRDSCSVSGRPETSEEDEVVIDDRGPDVGLEVIKPAPDAARQAVGSLQARYPGFDASTEVAQLAINPLAFDHVLDAEAGFLVERHVANAPGLCRGQVVARGEAAICSCLPRRLVVEGDVALQHRQQVLSLGSCMSAEVTVLSSRTTAPSSSFSCRALDNSARLISSQVCGRIALIVCCSIDFFGLHDHGSRAKARKEAESCIWNASSW